MGQESHNYGLRELQLWAKRVTTMGQESHNYGLRESQLWAKRVIIENVAKFDRNFLLSDKEEDVFVWLKIQIDLAILCIFSTLYIDYIMHI